MLRVGAVGFSVDGFNKLMAHADGMSGMQLGSPIGLSVVPS